LLDLAPLLDRALAERVPFGAVCVSLSSLLILLSRTGAPLPHHPDWACPRTVHREIPFRVRGGSRSGVSSMDDCFKRQTSTATPAEPGASLGRLGATTCSAGRAGPRRSAGYSASSVAAGSSICIYAFVEVGFTSTEKPLRGTTAKINLFEFFQRARLPPPRHSATMPQRGGRG
jgi:hypothetical protein